MCLHILDIYVNILFTDNALCKILTLSRNHNRACLWIKEIRAWGTEWHWCTNYTFKEWHKNKRIKLKNKKQTNIIWSTGHSHSWKCSVNPGFFSFMSHKVSISVKLSWISTTCQQEFSLIAFPENPVLPVAQSVIPLSKADPLTLQLIGDYTVHRLGAFIVDGWSVSVSGPGSCRN